MNSWRNQLDLAEESCRVFWKKYYTNYFGNSGKNFSGFSWEKFWIPEEITGGSSVGVAEVWSCERISERISRRTSGEILDGILESIADEISGEITRTPEAFIRGI